MGMFDTVRWTDAAEAPTCAVGHPLLSFQTKERAWPSMETLYVREGVVYVEDRGSRDEAIVHRDGAIVLQHTTALVRSSETHALVLTSTCSRCDPVLSWNREWRGNLRTEHPLQQFRLTLESGLVTACTAIERETSADLAEEQRRQGLRVVPLDSDLYRELREDTPIAGD